MEKQTLKCSAIYVALAGKTGVYRSLREMPPGLKESLAKTCSSMQTATLVIADRNGRDELLRAMHGRQEQLQKPRATLPQMGRVWLDVTLLAVLGILLWLVAILR